MNKKQTNSPHLPSSGRSRNDRPTRRCWQRTLCRQLPILPMRRIAAPAQSSWIMCSECSAPMSWMTASTTARISNPKAERSFPIPFSRYKAVQHERKMRTLYGIYKKHGRDAFLDAAKDYSAHVRDTVEDTLAEMESRWYDAGIP